MKSIYFIKYYDKNEPKPTFATVESDSLLERMALPGSSDLVKITEMTYGIDYRFLIEVKNSVYKENTEFMFRYDNHSIIDQSNNIVNIKIFSGIYRILSHFHFPYANELTGSVLHTTGNTVNPLYNPAPAVNQNTQSSSNTAPSQANTSQSTQDEDKGDDGHTHQ